ncbi:MAG: zinc-ribbon domain-containing protein [Rhodocyclales bacterium]|nr:zinc-ribbon domain-containing protein [Rhodocyclales bacterium]
MLTRCPACTTHFRVTAEQLKARSGRVRCGECQQVFNALDTLIEEPMRVVAELPAEPLRQAILTPPLEAEAKAAGYPQAPIDQVTLVPPTPEATPEAALELEVPEELSIPDPETQGASIPEPAVAAEPDTVAEADIGTRDWSETFHEAPPSPRRWPWVIGSVIGLTALGLQAVLAFRVELAVLWPEVRPALVALCDIADCEVGLPAKVGLVGIEASDLHPDSERAGRLALTATLKNRAPFAQQFPYLELTLTDTADKAIARKVLAPTDYLPPKASIANGMQPNADIAIAVGVEPGEMAASGYRLYLFYP